MFNCLMVFIGGGLGSVLRYLTNILSIKYLSTHYPIGTFFANILGCLFLGFVVSLALNKSEIISPNMKLFLTVGFAGGFTTFSTFSYESLTLMKHGHLTSGILYTGLSILMGLLAVYAGMYFAKGV